MKTKVKFDKSLNKYHIYYEKLKDKNPYRYNILKEVNDRSDMFILIETHLGSINDPDPQEFARELERKLTANSIQYGIQPMEVRVKKNILGVFSMNKNPIKDFSISFCLKKATLTEELFNEILCEFDLQIGYNLLKTADEIQEDIRKGYFNTSDTSAYYGETVFDSMIFHKFLATEDVSQFI